MRRKDTIDASRVYEIHCFPAMSFILTINGGSSSIKFAVFDTALARVLTGQVSRIGLKDSTLEYSVPSEQRQEKKPISAPDHAATISPLIALISEHAQWDQIQAVGHRIVHGGARFTRPEHVTAELLTELERIAPYAPEHLPAEIALLKAFAEHDADVPQIACFDTAFHRTLPRAAKILPLPRRYYDQDVRRYGFHGLSYEYLMSELERRGAAQGRVILAHLGNGASMAAVLDGKSVDTSMSFTPTAGLVMSTRAGDLDPGIVAYLAQTEKISPEQFHRMVNAESGLRGISGTSGDMRDLLEKAAQDERAADAVAVFCRQAKKFIGGYAAILGGLDTLVFSGGIGENAAPIRAQICEGMEFLGVEIDNVRNKAAAPIVSTDASRVTVRVIKTDEELEIARHVTRVISTR